MKRFARKTAQAGIALCNKLFGFDLYPVIKAGWERKVIRNSLSVGTGRKEGLNLFFQMEATNSVSKTGRDFARKLSQTTIPFSVIDTTAPWSSEERIPDGQEKLEVRALRSSSAIWHKSILFGGSELAAAANRDIYKEVFYEFDEGFMFGRPRFFHHVKSVCVFSDFCRNLVLRVAPSGFSVVKIRYPFIFPVIDCQRANRRKIRKIIGIPEDDFAVFFNFSLKALPGRKNPEAVVQAFSRAFGNRRNAWLVFKISNAAGNLGAMEKLHSFLAEKRIADRTVIVDSNLEMGQVLKLTAAMDVYLSLHRGEGLGLGMLEAMSLGIPVVATDYGGNTEFLNAGNSFPVPYERKVWTNGCGFPAKFGAWAEPDMDEASRILHSVFENASETARRVKNGIDFVREYYSLENFENDVRLFLKRD